MTMRRKRKLSGTGATDTLVGEDTIIEGKMISQAGIRVEGQVIGDIESEGDITVGEGAVLKSNIVAREATIAGTVHGNVTSKGKLIITSTGQLIGAIDVGSLTVMEGGVFQGTSRMELRPPEENVLASKREQKQLKQKNEAAAAAN